MSSKAGKELLYKALREWKLHERAIYQDGISDEQKLEFLDHFRTWFESITVGTLDDPEDWFVGSKKILFDDAFLGFDLIAAEYFDTRRSVEDPHGLSVWNHTDPWVRNDFMNFLLELLGEIVNLTSLYLDQKTRISELESENEELKKAAEEKDYSNGFRVFKNGEDVTETEEFYIDEEGCLRFFDEFYDSYHGYIRTMEFADDDYEVVWE